MNAAGWVFMTLSLAAVLTLVTWCYALFLRRPPK